MQPYNVNIDLILVQYNLSSCVLPLILVPLLLLLLRINIIIPKNILRRIRVTKHVS